ncbi:phenylalanine--tRNA ligase subunit alpha [bacterium]
MKKKIEKLAEQVENAISNSNTLQELEQTRVKYFGKKSELMHFLKSLNEFSKDEKPVVGKLVNEVKLSMFERYEQKKVELEVNVERSEKQKCDVTLPGKDIPSGHLHPLTHVLNEIIEVFTSLGFGIASGPDIETNYYNFSALNFPEEHPAQDTQDTFFLCDENKHEGPYLLRTHTSPVQIRFMEQHKPPFQIIIPGSVYRCDSDVSHTPMFHQIEGLAVGENVSFADLKGILGSFVHKMFGPKTHLRFRPSFFPFTEPSAEIDISCVICGGRGCRVCKDSGWLEILGAGMVHPNVLKNVNYDNEKYTGFAFGMGIERIAMLKFGIDDIRLFFENDLRFLKQF